MAALSLSLVPGGRLFGRFLSTSFARFDRSSAREIGWSVGRSVGWSVGRSAGLPYRRWDILLGVPFRDYGVSSKQKLN